MTNGGGTLGVLGQCQANSGTVRHAVWSLRTPSDPKAVEPFRQSNIPVVFGDRGRGEFRDADIVQIEWWNNPEINDMLVNEDLPECRLLLNSRAHFDAPWMCPSENLLRRVDYCTVTAPSAIENSTFERNRLEAGLPPATCVLSAAHFVPQDIRKESLRREVVFGYLGTVEPIKIHSRFLNIASSVISKVPDVSFVVAGDGTLDDYRSQARQLGINDKIRFLGHVSDTVKFLQAVDVFFYPLNKYTYATSEKALQEAMLASLPCVVFPYGGIRDVAKQEYALIAEDEETFARACVRLASSPSLRMELGNRAQRAIEELDHRNSVVNDLSFAFEKVMSIAPRARSSQNITRKQLMEYVADFSGVRPERVTQQDYEDCRQVATFVEDAYFEWLNASRLIAM